MLVIKTMSAKNHKTIKELKIELKPINVLIGKTGSGKSNFLSLFDNITDIFDFNKLHLLDSTTTVSENYHNLMLKGDASNLASIISHIKCNHQDYYQMIVATLTSCIDDFYDFMIEDDKLKWVEKNNTNLSLNISWLSSSSFRLIVITVLMLAPSNLTPNMIIMDNPELGLSSFSIQLLSGLIHRAVTLEPSLCKQIIISTQSSELISQFEPNDVIMVVKKNGYSNFTRLSNENLDHWLKDGYSLGGLWEQGVLCSTLLTN